MKQADKDRLFVLGLDVPDELAEASEKHLEDWIAAVVAQALLEGGEKAKQLLTVQEREDQGVYEEGGPAEGGLAAVEPPAAAGTVGDLLDRQLSDTLGGPGTMPPTFTELLEAGGVTFDLVELLEGIARTATELAEVARTEGDDAVNARLGELPAWPEFHAWAEAALTPAPAANGGITSEDFGLEPHTPEPEVEVDLGPAPALGSPGLAEVQPPPESEPNPGDASPDIAPAEESPPAGEPEPHSPEKLAELARELEKRELADAVARESAEVVTTDEPGGTGALPADKMLAADADLPGAATDEDWREAFGKELAKHEGRIENLESDVEAMDELTDRLELPLSGGPVTASPFPKEG